MPVGRNHVSLFDAAKKHASEVEVQQIRRSPIVIEAALHAAGRAPPDLGRRRLN
jgi:hypothetical protein